MTGRDSAADRPKGPGPEATAADGTGAFGDVELVAGPRTPRAGPEPARAARGHASHPRCFACGEPHGLGLRFRPLAADAADGRAAGVADSAATAVVAEVAELRRFEGYPGRAHGGIVATLLDAAMTHCLFLRGMEALTVRLCVRYRAAVAVDEPAMVTATLVRVRLPLLELRATVTQGTRSCATARATFYLPHQ